MKKEKTIAWYIQPFLFFYAIMETLALSLKHLPLVHVSIKILVKRTEVLIDTML